MRMHKRCAEFLGLLLILSWTIAHMAPKAHPILRDSVPSIITKAPFDGRKYLITIVPVDTTISNHMPVYGGAHPRLMMIRRDSLRHLPPDTILVWSDSSPHLLPNTILEMLQRGQLDLQQWIPKAPRR
jgi:hypothetical protein